MAHEIRIEAERLPADNSALRVRNGQWEIALFRSGDQYFALNNECSHHGAPLDQGWMGNGTVSCPWHGWQFELESGRCLSCPGYDVESHPVRMESDGSVTIEVKEE